MTHDLNHRPPTSSSMPPSALSADGSPVPVHWVEDLFGRLAAILGADAMLRLYGGTDLERVKAEWCEALATFTADEVRRGISSVRLRRFAPNLPEFLHLCRPALDPEVAWHEALDGFRACAAHRLFAWSHPAVYWAARAIEIETQPSDFAQVRKRWAYLLAAEFDRGSWPQPPDFRQRAIPAPKQEPIPDVPGRRDAVTAMLHSLQDRLRSPASLARAQAEQVAYTAAELADQRRAQQLAGQP